MKDISRFGRDYITVGNYITRVFPFMGLRFIAVNDNFDSSRKGDIDSLDRAFRALIYDLYSRDISKKVKSAKLQENVNIHDNMGAYNAAHNAEKAARRTAKRFADLTGDRWTTAELHAQGFTDRNIKTFVKNGLIKKLYQGRYQRVFV